MLYFTSEKILTAIILFSSNCQQANRLIFPAAELLTGPLSFRYHKDSMTEYENSKCLRGPPVFENQ